MKFKPKNKEELFDVIKEIVTNQLSNKSYRYGLKDDSISTNFDKYLSVLVKLVYTSLITDMSRLFSVVRISTNYDINEKIDWKDPRNSIVKWDVSNITDMSFMFTYSKFNQDISNWNINNIKSISYIFYNSKFKQDLSNWIFSLNKECSLINFNLMSLHEEKFGIIDGYDEFIQNSVYSNYINTISVKANCLQFNLSMKQLTNEFINNIIKNGSDKEKYQLLKVIKQYPDIIKNLDIDRELL